MKCPKCGSINTETAGYNDDKYIEFEDDPQTIDDLISIVKNDMASYNQLSRKNFQTTSRDWDDPELDENPAMQKCLDCGHEDDVMEFVPGIRKLIDKKRMFEALE